MMGSRVLLLVAALLGTVGVGIGALGAHGLPDFLAQQGLDAEVVQKKLGQCETAVRYQLLHALAIFTIALSPAASSSPLLRKAAWVMFAGVLLFSGGLYSLVFANVLGHWAIIPCGGMLMIFGWITAGISSFFLSMGKSKCSDNV